MLRYQKITKTQWLSGKRGKRGKRGKEENEENEENPILWFTNIITVNQGGGECSLIAASVFDGISTLS